VSSLREEFDAFWAAYPRKRGGKDHAFVCYYRARRHASFATIMEGVRTYRWSPTMEYRPHPATWLNQHRWIEAAEDLAAGPYGLDAWLAMQPSDTLFSAPGWGREACLEVLQAVGMPEEWRGDLDVLGAWLVDGYRPDDIARILAEQAMQSRISVRLAWFDGLVRARALRWHGSRIGWRRASGSRRN
jgi:hypothetical protein